MHPQFIPLPLKAKNTSVQLKQHGNFRHGLSGTPIHAIWKSIVQRCTNPSCAAYIGYGGRGIQLYEEWKVSFNTFYAHVSSLPNYGEKGYSLDRINNDGNYEPENVKWSTRTEQNRNSRHNLLLTLNGKTQCVSVWAEEVGIKASTIQARIVTYGWSDEKALTTPTQNWGR